MRETIEIEKTYPHPIERVWRAISHRDALAVWFMENDFEPVVGHRFEFRTDPAPGFDGIVRCEVLEVEEPGRLAFSWRGGPVDTVVRIELESIPGGTQLRMCQSGFRGVRGRLVGWMLKSGGETLYGRRLPELLDRWRAEEEGAEAPSAGPEPIEECMEPRTRWLAWLSSLGLGRRQDTRS